MSDNELVDIGYDFRVGESTVNVIVDEVCEAIWEELQGEFMKFPEDEDVSKYNNHLYHFNQYYHTSF